MDFGQKGHGRFTFVRDQHGLFITFFTGPKIDLSMLCNSISRDDVYCRKMNIKYLYHTKTTDSTEGSKEGKQAKY